MLPLTTEPAPTTPQEIRAIQVAIGSSVIGATVKLTVGVLTGSMAMISSGADSVGDIFVSLANLFVVRIAARAPDADHNYGHAKAEGLGAMFEGGFIFAASVFVIYEAIRKLASGEQSDDSVLGIVVMLPMLGLTIGTVLYMRRVARATGSLVVKADALHYASDVYLNGGVLVALVLVKLTGQRIIDPIVSILIALNMIRASAGVVREGVAIVMDESLPAETVAKVRAVLTAAENVESFHELRTRLGKVPLVDFHISVPPETTTQTVHDVYLDLRGQIRAIVGPTTKVVMHADPSPMKRDSASELR